MTIAKTVHGVIGMRRGSRATVLTSIAPSSVLTVTTSAMDGIRARGKPKDKSARVAVTV